MGHVEHSQSSTTEARYSLREANGMLPLIRHIAHEVVERRQRRRQLFRLREDLEQSPSPEGLSIAIGEVDAEIYEQGLAIRTAVDELEELGLHVLRMTPLTVHIPGHTRQGEIVFCWQVGEPSVGHGHAIGEEEDPRRPLKVRATG